MIKLMRTFSWQEVRHHPWRHAAAVVAVMLGVALAFAVHLINASALSEFSAAVRSVGAQADLEVRAASGALDEAVLAKLARQAEVQSASPVLELNTRIAGVSVRVLGVDVLNEHAPGLLPRLKPRPEGRAQTWDMFLPHAVFLNPAARAQLPGLQTGQLRLQVGQATHTLEVMGDVSASGPPLAVMDIGAAQDLFEQTGWLSRIDVRLNEGADAKAFERQLLQDPSWPRGVLLSAPQDGLQRIDQLSRAYRVNLTVLALVALFTGAFLVFSVLSLSVAQRAQQFALLGVLGLGAAERLRLVLLESALLGVVGSVAGLTLGTGLAWAALHMLGGDLGGGYFPGVQPALQWDSWAALLYGGLGLLAAMAGGWWPAQQVGAMPVATTLKGLGSVSARRMHAGWSVALMLVGALLACLPSVAGMPLGAYVSIACLLLGGIMGLPALTALLLGQRRRHVRGLLPLLALERAHRLPHTASSAVSGVVAALSLAVALTVMVASFRNSVTQWLDVILPADVYVRSSATGTLNTGAGNLNTSAFLDPAWVTRVGELSQVKRVHTQRVQSVTLNPAMAPVVVIARPLGDVRQTLPLVDDPQPVPDGAVPIYVSEAMVDLYGARAGTSLPELANALSPTQTPASTSAKLVVAGVWRDYARQSGSVMMDERDYRHITQDARISDVALTLHSNTDVPALTTSLRELADAHTPGSGAMLEIAATEAIRATSLRLFDRSFAVTYWLQAVAIGIGLFGIAASFSAQVLARRKEFGLLAHLGLTRAQILRLVAAEGAAWTAIGATAGLSLGLLVSVILVHVVNPQSFHWTMDLQVPVWRLLALCAAVLFAGTLTAWLSGRAAAGHDAVIAVKEDW